MILGEFLFSRELPLIFIAVLVELLAELLTVQCGHSD